MVRLRSVFDLIIIFILMSSLACSVDIKEYFDRLKHPKGVLIGLFCQYVFLPLISWRLSFIFYPDNFALASSLILTATCPGGILSNLFAFLIGADLPLSIAMTTTSSLLSFGFIPLNIYLYIELGLKSSGFSFDFTGMVISVSILILGLIFGLILNHFKVQWMKKCLGVVSTLSLIFILTITIMEVQRSSYPMHKYPWQLWIAPLILTTTGWIFGLFFSLLLCMRKPSSVSVGIETSNQSTGLAIAILGLAIKDQDQLLQALSIPIAYTLLTWAVNAVGVVIFYYLGWVDQPSKDDKSTTFCGILASLKNYKKVVSDVNNDENQSEKENNDVETDIIVIKEIIESDENDSKELNHPEIEQSTENKENNIMVLL